MAEIDTSSYPRPPALPAQKSLLDTTQQFGTMQQQSLAIDQTKLKLYNDQFNLVNDELTTLANDPKTTPQEVITRINRKMDAFNAPPNIRAQMAAEFANLPQGALGPDGTGNPELARVLDLAKRRAQDINARVQSLYGATSLIDNGQQVTPARIYERGGPVANGAPIQRQLPPGTPTVNSNNQPTYVGAQPPQIPAGAEAIRNGLPGQYKQGGLPVAPITVTNVNPPPGGPSPALPVQPRSDTGVTPEGTPNVVQNRFPVPSGPAAGPTPMFEEGKKFYTADQENAAQKMQAIQPAIQALQIIKQPGFNSGPGTEAFTKGIAALKTWGLVDTAGENDPTVAYQQVAKKLADYVSRSPVGQRSDAAQTLKEAASPNPKVQLLPALIKLTEDAVALDRMEAARPNAFKGTNYEGYPKHRSLFPQSMDYRAFKLDMMGAEGQKLVDAMLDRYKKNPKDAEAAKFKRSLEIAQEYYQ